MSLSLPITVMGVIRLEMASSNLLCCILSVSNDHLSCNKIENQKDILFHEQATFHQAINNSAKVSKRNFVTKESVLKNSSNKRAKWNLIV